MNRWPVWKHVKAPVEYYALRVERTLTTTAAIIYAYTTETTLGDIVSSDVYGYQEGSGWGDRSSVNVYDGQGNPLYFNSYSLTWDGRRLMEMNRSSGQSVISFQYNQDGIRTSKTVDGVKHTYLLNGSQIVGETWGNNLLIYLYDESGSPIGMQYRNTNYDSYDFDTFYFEKNLQGDVVAVYNEDGEKVLRYTYDAWGNHTMSWYSVMGTDLYAQYNPFRYRGYYYDTETKLYYLQSRYYAPHAGRFLNADGYVNANGDLIGFNMYAYCNNNPNLRNYVMPQKQ